MIGSYGFETGHCSFIGGGYTNRIVQEYNMIGGGQLNYICGTASAIGGGSVNCIGNPGGAFASCSFIGGGCQNTISGNFSAILGGSGNNDGGFAYAGIFGQNITAVAANTFHAECLNACATPAGPGGLPSGTIYYITAGSPIPPGARALYIVP